MNENRFTERAQTALRFAHECASELGHGYVGSEHLLYGLCKEGEGVASKVLGSAGLGPEAIAQAIAGMVGMGTPGGTPSQGLTPRTKRVIEIAMAEAGRMGHNYVGTEHLLMGILREGEGIAVRILLSAGVDLRQMYGDVINAIGAAGVDQNPPSVAKGGRAVKDAPAENKTLTQFTKNLTKEAAEGKLDPVIGRSEEVQRVIQILSRRTKNNPVLIGEPGVGKTAIAEGLAQKIVSGDVPDTLAHKRILSLDLSGMIAGTKYRGEFEERIKAAMEEIKKAGDIILFIDELHTIIGAGAAEGAVDAANILKPALSRGEIQVIGATTLNEYRKYIEKDAALERRFQPVNVGEPSTQESIEILKGLRDRYEAHHKLRITDEAIEAAVAMSHRYIGDRFLPDKAIDLIDEAASRVRMRQLTTPPDLKEMEEKIKRLSQEKEEAVRAQEFEKAASLRDKEKELTKMVEAQRENWKSSQSETKNTVTENDVADVVAGWTGIPVTTLTETEVQRLLRLEEVLHQRLVGQDEAVSSVARAIRRSRVGLKDPKRPIGSFLFLGPTGVGKTELCKALAEAMFGDENAMIRIDMSEYMERHTVSRLIGSPPGYVGYDEGGQLSERVRRKPYSVVLFDEIEKANEDVFNLLLQVMEDGVLTDAQGHKVDFKNTVVVMTSNVGARNITEKSRKLGFSAVPESEDKQDYDAVRTAVMSDLKQTFRPEFLNRIDDVIVFHPLGKDDIRAIAKRMLQVVAKRIEDLGYTFHVEDAALDVLADAGFDKVYGARPLRREIQRTIEDALAEKMLDGSLKQDGEITAVVKDGAVVLAVKNKEKEPVPLSADAEEK